MSIRKKDKLELELMSYTDIAYEIIKEDNKQYNTPNLFKEVCNLLELSESEFEAKIGDFFTALSTDKRFILIDSIDWDLKENHVVKVIVDEGEDDTGEEIEDESIEEDEELQDEDDIDLEDDYGDGDIDDLPEDDLEDLSIVDEEDIEE
ncbi:MAG: DNA-directed RNA polymerase subunit delta [Bacilli bacterium]|nr:DNA-directed RNA polymerase subunit delta [Bacilli bacterium]